MVIKGRSLENGLPEDITITAEEIRGALADPLMVIIEAVKNTLEKTPPELSADIIDHGIMLTGGGAMLRGLDKLIMQHTGMPVHVADRPLDCVVEGTGKKPKATDTVRCHYEGRLLDGTVFDSSYKRNEPADFGLQQVIAGWTEGVQLMGEGAKFRFYIPYLLAYGEGGAGGMIPPFATLIFDVELIKVL
jgi:hypothetical protein